MMYNLNIENIDAELAGRAQLAYYYADGRGNRLLAYPSCSSPNQLPLQRLVIYKQKARGTSWVMIKESIVLSYSSGKKAGHASTPIPSSPHRPCRGQSP
ncbi:hypothetical protein PoB_003400700 [Plakobranchus ocellatus]|uniref:Uncharacterized protein n=1 Tax=Plakobranchus ocellatus TaxID=259542 RepID=A0AAV4AKG8_9GAST|nr:hypothetical protein PoB_003400700 [Plakobranchus ocellatus]